MRQNSSPIVQVRATDSQILLTLRRTGAAITLSALGVWETAGAVAWSGKATGQELALPRFDSQKHDRLYQRWQAYDSTGKPLGVPQWATDLSGLTRRTQPIPWPRSIKGVQCVVDLEDAVALGAKHVGLNLSIRELLLPAAGTATENVPIDGTTIALDAAALRRYDEQVQSFAHAGILVTAIFLNYFPRDAGPDDLLVHPDCDRKGAANPLSAFNLSNATSTRLYCGLLHFLAQRWREQITGFIIGNEVQSHWHWYNIGKAAPEKVIREYANALRLAWLAVKSAHAQQRVFISMDYYWTDRHEAPDRTMPGRQLVDGLNAISKAEGDFDWHVAQHPYPQGLFDPVFWDDEDAGMGFDTPIVTFKNIEVLLAYLNRPEQKCAGAARRVILSEQGFNCKGEGDAAEQTQAAAYAYAYQKVSQLPGIDAFILHRHQDHPQEGGLKLGLRRLDGSRRPMWTVFQKADTPEWRKTFDPLLPQTGLARWDDARPRTGPIREVSGLGLTTLYAGEVVWDGVKQLWTATPTNCLDWRLAKEKNAAGVRVAGLFQHPRASGAAEASFPITLPRLSTGQRLRLRFEVLNSAVQPSPNGIRFGVQVDGKPLWSANITDCKTPHPQQLDLSAYAGKAIRLTLTTDANGKEAYCWATWLAPAIVIER